jgi:hypothetical protein
VAPLVYFLFPFGTYFINVSDELMANSPVLFSIIYISTLSATKQVGGILFSMVFLTAAALVNRTELRRYLVISAIGISILFGCIDELVIICNLSTIWIDYDFIYANWGLFAIY